MAGVKKVAGPSSDRVRRNLLRLRRQRGLSAAELARRLADLGQPILDTGIIKIEKGDRRVDVDDLVALAVALNVTPNALLLPEVVLPAGAAIVALTPQQDGRMKDLWAWATGEIPLGHKPVTSSDDEAARSAEWTFAVANRPHRWGGGSHLQPLANAELPHSVRHSVPAALGATVVAAFTAGVSTAEIRDIVETAITSSVAAGLDQFPPAEQAVIRGILQVLEQVPDGFPLDEKPS